MINTDKITEKVLLVAVNEGDEAETRASLDELEELCKTAGAQVVGRILQNLERRNPTCYVGKGKVDAIADLLLVTEATGIVCDDELTPAQMRNLAEMLDTKVMDRTLIILDIFAARAGTAEGKIQVELAQLRYEMTRLTGFGKNMSRVGGTAAGGGGAIGTRGPGEKKLEMDKRLISGRITKLKEELADVVSHREITRSKRRKNKLPVAAIVGYTNAGKSSFLNKLTNAGILEWDALFATLDPTTRELILNNNQKILLTDTVGFIRKLPHHLIDAFKSTLEEAKYADFIIHVVDVSNPQMDRQMEIVYETLTKLEVIGKPVLTVFNKVDKLEGDYDFHDLKADYSVYASVKTGQGLDAVREILATMVRAGKKYVERLIPYSEAGSIAVIREKGELISEEYREDGIFITAYI
ncbi:MAG: GTPase HflX [Lachnospiraceae bacterium]|nr:GTPase HflX [Lachnospiraceae bacterium]